MQGARDLRDREERSEDCVREETIADHDEPSRLRRVDRRFGRRGKRAEKVASWGVSGGVWSRRETKVVCNGVVAEGLLERVEEDGDLSRAVEGFSLGMQVCQCRETHERVLRADCDA